MGKNRLTKRINGVLHGAEGKNINDLTGKWCRGQFECTALLEKLAEYEDAEENGLLVKLPFKIGQDVFVDTNTLPIEKMKFDNNKEMPLIHKGKVVSFRKNRNGLHLKISIIDKFLHEWVDYETGSDADYFEDVIHITYRSSALKKAVFLTKEEAEKALKEKK